MFGSIEISVLGLTVSVEAVPPVIVEGSVRQPTAHPVILSTPGRNKVRVVEGEGGREGGVRRAGGGE